jgi:hypothetical protein
VAGTPSVAADLSCAAHRRGDVVQHKPGVTGPRAPPLTQWCGSMDQVSLNQVYRFDQASSARVERLRKEARGTPNGVRRDELLRRAQQIESASSVHEQLAFRNLQPPS